MDENIVKILVKRIKISLDITQFYIDSKKKNINFIFYVIYIIRLLYPKKLFFVNHKKIVEWLCSKMRENFFTVSIIHGDLPKKKQKKIMQEFRIGETLVI